MEQTAQEKEKADFDRIYVIYFPKLVRFSQTYLLYREEAENMVQDLFLQLWEHRDQIPFHGNLNAYFFTVVKNRCIDILRKHCQMHQRQYSLSEVQYKELEFKLYSLQKFDENNFSLAEIEQIILRAVDALPPRCREIFWLSRMEGLKHKEIAERLNISVNTVEGQIAIALRKLKVGLKDYLPLFILIC